MNVITPNQEGFGKPVYKVSPSSDENAAISAILNEARHVYDWHKEGMWKTEHKEGFARLLIPYIRNHPKLILNINRMKDRIFSMVGYRAVELMKEDAL